MSKLNVPPPSQNPTQSHIDTHAEEVERADSPFAQTESSISIKLHDSPDDSNSKKKTELTNQENQSKFALEASPHLRSSTYNKKFSQGIPGQTNSSSQMCLGLNSRNKQEQRTRDSLFLPE